MIRVLHIVGGMDRAGAETMIMNLYRNIDREKVQFDFLYFTNKKCDFDDEIYKLGGKIYRVVESNPLLRFYKTKSFLTSNQYKIVQSHTLFNIGFNMLAASLAKIPIRIAHSHSTSTKDKGFLGSMYKKLSRFLIKQYSTDFIACGDAAGKYLFGKKSDFIVLQNSIDVKHFNQIGKTKKDYWETQFNIKSETLKIIQVGRLQEVKNHQLSLQICKQLKEQGVDFHFFVVGQGSLETTIKQSILDFDLGNSVTLLGVRSDIPELMAGANIHLMPSLHEGFPVVLVEAQAIGLPSVISSAISKEVDLGLGLVTFLDLNDDLNSWTNEIKKQKNENPDSNKIIEKLTKSGFDSKRNAIRLQKLYLDILK